MSDSRKRKKHFMDADFRRKGNKGRRERSPDEPQDDYGAKFDWRRELNRNVEKG